MTKTNGPSPSKLWGILPAAGIGARMGTNTPKQYLEVAGKAIIQHSIELMLTRSELESLTVCLAAGDIHFAKLGITHPKLTTTAGGNTRADSVLNGLKSIRDKAEADDWVLVHDAARPCLEPAMLARMIDTLVYDQVGGILATRAKDTLKKVLPPAPGADQQSVSYTLDRSDIWQAQTPQLFRYGLLTKALEFCLEHNLEVTDEASALEHAGYPVKLVEGSATNIKVTNPEDRLLAEFLLSQG